MHDSAASAQVRGSAQQHSLAMAAASGLQQQLLQSGASPAPSARAATAQRGRRLWACGAPAGRVGQLPHHPPISGCAHPPLLEPCRNSKLPWLRPADHSESPFHELDIAEIGEGLGRTRVRQHVNPLRREHQEVTGAPDWQQTFERPQAPLVVDLGCGPGRFLLLLKHRHDAGRVQHQAVGLPPAGQPLNLLGLEIRKPLVDRAAQWCERLGYGRSAHFITSNATISLGHILRSYPGSVQLVCICMPDPHFKKRHHKRRIFQPSMVKEVAGLLAPGGHLFLQSDVLEVAVAMRNVFEKYASDVLAVAPAHLAAAAAAAAGPDGVFFEELPAYAPQGASPHEGDGALEGVERRQGAAGSGSSSGEDDPPVGAADPLEGSDSDSDGSGTHDDYLEMRSVWAEAGWLRSNPICVPTEREHYVLQQGLPVYRVLLVKRPA